MKTLWCWRCRREMPMLDELEYAEVFRLYGECARDIKEFRGRWSVSLADDGAREHFHPVRAWYARLTGISACDENAILHHRLSNFGGPCCACGKPLRSPRARRCAACGALA
jgi:hypothetical protein